MLANRHRSKESRMKAFASAVLALCLAAPAAAEFTDAEQVSVKALRDCSIHVRAAIRDIANVVRSDGTSNRPAFVSALQTLSTVNDGCNLALSFIAGARVKEQNPETQTRAQYVARGRAQAVRSAAAVPDARAALDRLLALFPANRSIEGAHMALSAAERDLRDIDWGLPYANPFPETELVGRGEMIAVHGHYTDSQSSFARGLFAYAQQALDEFILVYALDSPLDAAGNTRIRTGIFLTTSTMDVSVRSIGRWMRVRANDQPRPDREDAGEAADPSARVNLLRALEDELRKAPHDFHFATVAATGLIDACLTRPNALKQLRLATNDLADSWKRMNCGTQQAMGAPGQGPGLVNCGE